MISNFSHSIALGTHNNSSSQAHTNINNKNHLPTLFEEEIENMHPMDPKEFSYESHPPCTVGMYELSQQQICAMPFDESDEDYYDRHNNNKENIENLLALF